MFVVARSCACYLDMAVFKGAKETDDIPEKRPGGWLRADWWRRSYAEGLRIARLFRDPPHCGAE